MTAWRPFTGPHRLERPFWRDEGRAQDLAEALGLAMVSDWDEHGSVRWLFYGTDGAYLGAYLPRSGRLFQAGQAGREVGTWTAALEQMGKG